MEGRVLKYVGLLCNCAMDSDPMKRLSPSIVNRAFLIDELLAPEGIRVFLYCPSLVVDGEEVPGYRIEGRNLVPAKQAVPRVNANWTYGTRRLLNKGMGYGRFKRWARENEVGVYVPYAFSELVSNKRKAYDLVREYDASLHPHTEHFIGSKPQIASFFERSDLVFLKPRSGNKGNRIFVLRRSGEKHSLRYYDTRSRRSFSDLTLEAALSVVDAAAGKGMYVAQQGVESLRYEGSVFDVRVVMVNDGCNWHSILETRLAPPDSDVSNVFQGGSIRVTEELFESMFGTSEARLMEEEVRRVSHGLARHLEALYPSELMEMGFDFVLDRNRGLHLVELNAKPGVAGFGSESRVFDWNDEDRPYYERWVRPHVTYLAEFLRRKVENV